jgi:cysteine desulfurase/selenocysteine lyase
MNKPQVFLAYTTVAPMCRASYQAVKQFYEEFYSVGPPEVLYKYDPMHEDLAAEAAKLLNCDSSEITYTKNTTEGIHIASEALPLEKGDEVLVLANEYPANLLPWLKKKKDGVSVKLIGSRDSEKSFEELVASINPHTKAIAISSSQSYDGYMFNLPLLSKLCEEKDIFLVLDAVQSVGVRKIDLQKTPVDFLLCGGQKYLRAGVGIGFMYVNKRTIPKLKDFKVGIRSMQSFDETSYILKDNSARFQDGTQNLGGIVALIAALRQVNEIGIDNIEKRNLELLAQAKACLKKYNVPFIDHGNRQGNILAMKVDSPQELFEFLKANGVYLKTIKDVLRISFIHETKIEDIETAAKMIRGWLDGNKS